MDAVDEGTTEQDLDAWGNCGDTTVGGKTAAMQRPGIQRSETKLEGQLQRTATGPDCFYPAVVLPAVSPPTVSPPDRRIPFHRCRCFSLSNMSLRSSWIVT